VHINKTDLGAIIKAARLNKGLTQETLGEHVGVGLRHMMAIENEGSNPSYDVLYRIIRELHIPADTIFWPEAERDNAIVGEIVRMLYDLDERSLKVVHATVQAALDSQTL
jgi:transcriptional regulator with XRE-family HTH domain